MPFPPEGLVYDYKLDDGLSFSGKDEEDEEEGGELKVSRVFTIMYA